MYIYIQKLFPYCIHQMHAPTRRTFDDFLRNWTHKGEYKRCLYTKQLIGENTSVACFFKPKGRHKRCLWGPPLVKKKKDLFLQKQ